LTGGDVGRPVLVVGRTDDLVLARLLGQRGGGVRQLGRGGAELAVGQLPTVGGYHVAVLGPQGADRHAHLLGGGGHQLAPHLGADDPDRVPQHAGVVGATGDLRCRQPLLGRRQGGVHVLVGHVEVVGHHHGGRRDDALADVLAGQLEVDPVVGLD